MSKSDIIHFLWVDEITLLHNSKLDCTLIYYKPIGFFLAVSALGGGRQMKAKKFELWLRIFHKKR